MEKVREKFWEKYSLDKLNEAEWEALCDGCGKCCLIKFENEGKLFMTNIACVQMDLRSCRCTSYKQRVKIVKNCLHLTWENLKKKLNWLPFTCSYKLVYEKKPLPSWHHLICKDKDKVHQKGFSIQNRCVHESKVKSKNFVSHIIAEIKT